MPIPRKWKNKKNSSTSSSSQQQKKNQPPDGFDYIEPILEILENELRDKVKESNANKRKTESLWPVHQINWQKSRYVYDMYYTYKKISNQVYQYCLQQKLIDASLIAKWKKPGYEKLCSTYVINPQNYKFGTTSICRVPLYHRSDDQKNAKDPTTGCMGCASGKNAGPKNIFGNKYGQNLAAVQIAREKRREEKEAQERLKQQQQLQQQQQKQDEDASTTDDDDDDETDSDTDDDDDDDDDYGPSPAAGIWAGSQKLQNEANHGDDDDDDDTTDDDDEEDGPKPPPAKKVRVEGDDE